MSVETAQSVVRLGVHPSESLSSLVVHTRALAANFTIVLFLIAYAFAGGFVLLHFEWKYAESVRVRQLEERKECVEKLFRMDSTLSHADITLISSTVVMNCMEEEAESFRHEWSFKTATLYGFGILTTLGYGKIEPRTRNGRVFAVIYGFFGIPVTVILLTNFGRYLERMALRVKRNWCKLGVSEDDEGSVNGRTLFIMVLLYLVFGAVMIPLLEGEVDFFNGIYFAFICLTAIEYGDLVPSNNWLVPFSILYVCIGLAISTIALDLGSIYVRKLHYLGRKIRNIANMKIWFGARDLRVHELVNAVGHNIGLQDELINDIDIDYLVNVAIQVKAGRLIQVPQSHVIEGIWPPELVPLFMKDGNFPVFVDCEEHLEEKKREEESAGSPPPITHVSSLIQTDRLPLTDDEDEDTTDMPSTKEEELEEEERGELLHLTPSPPPSPPLPPHSPPHSRKSTLQPSRKLSPFDLSFADD